MSSNAKAPLRDQLSSNTSDPIKSAILKESGKGWNTLSQSSPNDSSGTTTPLRIAKRESTINTLLLSRQPSLTRRSSGSYQHMRNNNLVSKSPFRSHQPSTPSEALESTTHPVAFPTRRVSGEKRARPLSLHEQTETENERPFALKRERKQSKTYQALVQREPVSKSPFREHISSTEEDTQFPSPPLLISDVQDTLPFPPVMPAAKPAARSPGRSNLVSRRLHGPRMSGNRRPPQKSVTFDERCDVVEFEREEEESDDEVFESADEQAIMENDTDDDPFFKGTANQEFSADQHDVDEEYELSDVDIIPGAFPINKDADYSITGMMDEMIASNAPPRIADLSEDLELDDNHTQHIEREAFYHQQRQASLPVSLNRPPQYPFAFNPPPRLSPGDVPLTPSGRSTAHSFSKTSSLGESAHIDRTEVVCESEDEDIAMLPASPPPHEQPHSSSLPEDVDVSLTPESDVVDLHPAIGTSYFIANQIAIGDASLTTAGDSSSSLDPANLSIGHSEVSLSGLDNLHEDEDGQAFPDPMADEKQHNQAQHSLLMDNALFTLVPPAQPTQRVYFTSSTPEPPPTRKSPSPVYNTDVPASRTGSLDGRPRITREDVMKRLHERRSSEGSNDQHATLPTEQSWQSTENTTLEHSSDFAPPLQGRRESSLRRTDRVSLLTTATDMSTEVGEVHQAERMWFEPSPTETSFPDYSSLGMPEPLGLDFGQEFEVDDIRDIGRSINSRERLFASRAPIGQSHDGRRRSRLSDPMGGLSLRDENSISISGVDVEMRSALDRLMDNVSATNEDESMTMDNSMASEATDATDTDHEEVPPRLPPKTPHFSDSQRPKPIERAATDTALLSNDPQGLTRNYSGSSTASSRPSSIPSKEAIRSRELLILEKRREARRLEGEGCHTPSNVGSAYHVGRPTRRRSFSTGDVDSDSRRRRRQLLSELESGNGIGNFIIEDDPLCDAVERELWKLEDGPSKVKYHVREQKGVIYATSAGEDISHLVGPGDVNAGKAWRTVRRPSDMNEYAKQLKEYRAQDRSSKAYGKVFVKVIGIKGLHLPLPDEATALTCTLNNGIHFVTTPECELGPDCRIDQEFELIEHSKLEFTLTLKIRRDPHIISQFKALTPLPIPQQTRPHRTGVLSFFSSPKRLKEKAAALATQIAQPLTENFARYLKPDGTLARAFVTFKDIAARCDSRIFETTYPLIGQRVEAGNKYSTLQVGELVLQIFRLPPLPGLPVDQLPQSLDECHRGLRHTNWHKVIYYEGTLTQNGGDCNTWKRRRFRVIGANLVAFNDITKRPTASIDLAQAIGVEDDQDPSNVHGSALAISARNNRHVEDGLVKRSLRLLFPDDQEIVFFADTDEEKANWLEVFRALVGHIPPHPLWGEMLWQYHEELSQNLPDTTTPSSSSSPELQSPIYDTYDD